MKKFFKIMLLFVTALSLLGTVGCKKKEETTVIKRTIEAGAVVLPSEITAYADEAAYEKYAAHGIEPEDSQEGYGVAVSADYTMKIDNAATPVYCTPMYIPLDKNNPIGDLHNFATVSVNEGGFPVTIELQVADSQEVTAVKILPERRDVEATLSENKITFSVSAYGNYTVALNGEAVSPFTLFVQKAVTEEAFPDGMKVRKYPKGFHFVESIELTANTVLYLESGAYLYALPPSPVESPVIDVDSTGKPRYKAFIRADGGENIQIIGDGAYLDFAGLDWHARDPISIKNCKNVLVQGVTIVNAPQWNFTAMACDNLTVDAIKIFGYRTNSDGIEIVDCKNTTIKNCFVRSGDDLYGVKSMSTGLGCNHVLFEDNVAWPDKVRGFGVMHETQSDISDITFRRCDVLFRYSDWMDELGSLAVVVGDSGTISNITFEDIEIYHDVRYPVVLGFKKDEFSSAGAYGKIENITFRNVKYNSHENTMVRMNAVLPENNDRIKNIKFENIFDCGNKITDIAGLKLNLTYVSESEITVS